MKISIIQTRTMRNLVWLFWYRTKETTKNVIRDKDRHLIMIKEYITNINICTPNNRAPNTGCEKWHKWTEKLIIW